MLSGRSNEIEREALLYFDDVNLQCARWGRWKLHVSRYNNVTYSPAPAGGRVNFPLKQPELYDLLNDPEESYDVAPENPQVVAEIRSRIGRLMAGFPEPIRRAYTETSSRATGNHAIGAVTRPADR